MPAPTLKKVSQGKRAISLFRARPRAVLTERERPSRFPSSREGGSGDQIFGFPTSCEAGFVSSCSAAPGNIDCAQSNSPSLMASASCSRSSELRWTVLFAVVVSDNVRSKLSLVVCVWFRPTNERRFDNKNSLATGTNNLAKKKPVPQTEGELQKCSM